MTPKRDTSELDSATDGRHRDLRPEWNRCRGRAAARTRRGTPPAARSSTSPCGSRASAVTWAPPSRRSPRRAACRPARSTGTSATRTTCSPMPSSTATGGGRKAPRRGRSSPPLSLAGTRCCASCARSRPASRSTPGSGAWASSSLSRPGRRSARHPARDSWRYAAKRPSDSGAGGPRSFPPTRPRRRPGLRLCWPSSPSARWTACSWPTSRTRTVTSTRYCDCWPRAWTRQLTS